MPFLSLGNVRQKIKLFSRAGFFKMFRWFTLHLKRRLFTKWRAPQNEGITWSILLHDISSFQTKSKMKSCDFLKVPYLEIKWRVKQTKHFKKSGSSQNFPTQLGHSCSRTCGGGIKERHRNTSQSALHGGMACPGEAFSIAACNLDSCPSPPKFDCLTSNPPQLIDEIVTYGSCLVDETDGM